MTGYAARAVPWPLVAVACATVAGLLSLVAASPWAMWPLQGTAAGVLAGAVAWSMDEPATAVVDTLPRGLRWRTAARSSVVPVLLGVWAVSLVSMRGRIPGHLQLFLLQGLGAVSLALAVTTWRRARGGPGAGPGADPPGLALSVPRSGGSGRRPRSAARHCRPSGRR